MIMEELAVIAILYHVILVGGTVALCWCCLRPQSAERKNVDFETPSFSPNKEVSFFTKNPHVCVTAGGECFHFPSCGQLKKARNVKQYRACQHCMPDVHRIR